MARMTLPLIVLLVCFLQLETHAAVIAKSDSSLCTYAPKTANHQPYLRFYSASTSPSTNDSQPPLPASKPVSWQSAFWSLVALALNAMTQNSTFDRKFPSGVLFPARSSPLVCAADALEALLRLLAYRRAGASVPDAARLVVRESMWQPPRSRVAAGDNRGGEAAHDSNDGEQPESPLTLGNQYPPAHTVVFVLGVLPQAVKLFSMRGIPWTQVWGGMYLSSFLVLAGVGALARCARGDTRIPSRGAIFGEKTMGMLKLGVMGAAHVVLWVWCMGEMLRPAWGNMVPLLYMILVIPAFFGLIAAIVSVIGIAVYFSFSATMRFLPTFLGTVVCFVIFVLLLSLYGYSVPHLAEVIIWMDCFVIWPYVLMAIFVATKIASSSLLMIFFGMANLVLSILYYCFRYNQTGTFKPSWTEKLG